MNRPIKHPFWMYALYGIGIGLCNGLFGSGGGVAAVLVLTKWAKLETHRAHATAISIILPLSLLSLVIYLWKGNLPLAIAGWSSLGGVIGGALGAKLLAKLSSVWINRLFALLMFLAALRLFFA